MTYEQTEHQIKQLIAHRDAGFGMYYLPSALLDACLRTAYKAGCLHGAEITGRIVADAFAESVKGEKTNAT
jgi:hypothetical protein